MKRFTKNNDGFSLVELMVSVAILMVVMGSVLTMLALMSSSFSTSQKEVQLQDSVQATYTIVSDIIKEAQTETNNGINSVQYDKIDKKAYIIDEDTQDWTKSKFYIVEYDASKKILYLYSENLYTDITAAAPSAKVDYKNINVKSLSDKDSYLLAKNVKSFSIDDSKYNNGYVILTLEIENGSRTASITQNVYLRNSNNQILASGEESSDGKNETEGYKLVEIKNITCSKNPYSEGDIPKKSDFVVTGKYEKEDDPTDTKEAPVTDYVCDKIGQPLNTPGNVDFVFKVPETDIEKTFTVTVNAASLSVQYDGSIYAPELTEVTRHSEINTYFASLTKDSTPCIATGQINLKQVFPYYYKCKGSVTKYICPYCGNQTESWGHNCSVANAYVDSAHLTNVNEVCGAELEEAGTPGYVKNCSNSACSNYGWGSFAYDGIKVEKIVAGEANEVSDSVTIKSTGTGQFSIINDSKTTTYKDVKVVIYFKNDKAGFTNAGMSNGEFLSVNSAASNGTQKVSYKTVGDKSTQFSEYLEITIPEMPAADGEKYCTYTFNYKWASAEDIDANDIIMAVFSEDGTAK